MSFGYTELTLSLDSDETLIFDVKEGDGVSTDLSGYAAGVCSITNIKTSEHKTIGTVTIEPTGIIGRIQVKILAADMDGTATVFTQDAVDLYGTPPLNFALSVKLDNEVKIRAKVRLVKVG